MFYQFVKYDISTAAINLNVGFLAGFKNIYTCLSQMSANFETMLILKFGLS